MSTPSKRILVTGDYGYDYDIYLPTDEDNPPPGAPPTQINASVGGAGIAFRILQAIEAQPTPGSGTSAAAPEIKVGFAGRAEGVTAPPTAALWQKFKLGKLGKTPEAQNTEVWRVRRSLSLGRITGANSLPTAELPPMTDKAFKPDVVLVEDNVGGFRFQVPDWLQSAAKDETGTPPEWIVLKTSAPICHGAFWWALSGPKSFQDRLVVVVSIRELRTSEIRVSQGISWERTALDLARELTQSPLLEGLRQARHVVVTLHGEGALWMERVGSSEAGSGDRRFTLWFDPGCMEEEWARQSDCAEGNAYGFQSTFAASVAAHLALGGQGGLRTGIVNGLRAMRLLRALGHGPVESTPGLPANALAAVIRPANPQAMAITPPPMPPLDTVRLGNFGCAVIPAAVVGAPTPTAAHWHILEASDGQASSDQPLYGLGRRVALLGLEGLRNVPYASFGKLFTADRDEIEALRNIQRLIQDYEKSAETKPLSIAVFGPPGAGKSFGIKEIAKTAMRGPKSFLEFNLSQFEDTKDLIGAFHQVRDKVLEGGTPIVFWDEFDSQDYKWLQFLLAPMQDGKFQEGPITHPIGKCIFVFAGATCYDLQSFGPPEKPASEDIETVKEHKRAVTEFRLRKGPDFKSRLHGNLNVLGPNQRQRFHPARRPGEQWADDATDVCFPVRRAILLRSWLGLMDPDKKQSRAHLDMDPGLLAALLEVDHYRHGARSMEKVVMAVKQDGKHGYRRSSLPSNEVLEMNLKEPDQFLEIMDQPRAFQQHAWKLARAIHAAWANEADREKAYNKDFDELPEEAKGDNYAAAVRIPVTAGLVGLQFVEKSDPQAAVPAPDAILEKHIELLAEEEHKGWMAVKVANGWKKAPPPRDKVERNEQRKNYHHHCLVPYAQLTEEDKNFDRLSIRNFPTVAALAGFKIVARRSGSGGRTP